MAQQAVTGKEDSGVLTGMFRDRASTERAYSSLRDRGYSDDDINVMMSDETRDKYYADGADTELGNKALEGAGTGGAIGGLLGAVIGGIAAIGTNVLLPGLGLVVAGPIAAALAGAGAGGATGGIIGALIGAGIPEDRAKEYERGLEDGGILIGTRYRDADHAKELERDFTSYGGSNVRY